MDDNEAIMDLISKEAVANKTQTVNLQQNNTVSIHQTQVNIQSPPRKKHKNNDRPELPQFIPHEHGLATFTDRQCLLIEPQVNAIQDYLSNPDRLYSSNLKAYYFAKLALQGAKKMPEHTFKYINTVVEAKAAKFNTSLISQADQWCKLTPYQQQKADTNNLTGGLLFTPVLMKHPFLFSACFATIESRSQLKKARRKLELICPVCHQRSPLRSICQDIILQDKPTLSSKFRVHVKPMPSVLNHLQDCHIDEHHIHKFSNFTVELHRLFYDIFHHLQGLGNDALIEAITKDHNAAFPNLAPLQIPPEHDNDKQEREKAAKKPAAQAFLN